jgi:regulator of sigma E protease
MVSFLGFSLPDYSTKIVALEPHSRHFHTGDTILTVDGEKVSYYTDILKVLPEDFSPVVFEVERNGRTEILDLETSTVLFMEQVRPWIPLKIQDVQENSPARLAGFKTGDEILSVDGQSVAYFDQLENIKTQNKSGEYTVEVKRGKEVLTLSLLTAMPRWGILFQTPETRTEKATSVGDALSKGVIQTASFMKRAFMGIWGLILSPFAQSSHISGPIGIANQLAVAQSVGFTVWLQLLGFISASLAAMNLFFPISILDGGQIFIIFLEGIRRKRFSPSTLLRIHTVGVFLILGLLLLGVFNDISGLTR